MLQRATVFFIACFTSLGVVCVPPAAGAKIGWELGLSEKPGAAIAPADAMTALPRAMISFPADQSRDRRWWALISLSLLLVLSSSTLLAFSIGRRYFPKADSPPWRQADDLINTEAAAPHDHPSAQASLHRTAIQGSGNGTRQVVDVAGEPVNGALAGGQEAATPLTRVNTSAALLEELHSPDASVRYRVIWELGQRGTSETVPALVDTLIDADSKERSLILAAISEIGIRTLRPMHRALVVSLQDENPEVRKNAIRDLTRVYDLMGQLSQTLGRAAQDPDREVQETAQWALEQLGRMRQLAGSTHPIGSETQEPRWSEEGSRSHPS
jgi:hypothetical protein